jgi:hypothetical protein
MPSSRRGSEAFWYGRRPQDEAEREPGVEESSARDCCPTQTGRDSKGFTEEDRRLLKKTWRQGEIQADLDRRHHRAGGGDKVEGQPAHESSSSQEHSPAQSCQSFPESVHSDASTTVSEWTHRNNKLFAHLQIRRSASSAPVAGEDRAPSTETGQPQSQLTHTASTENEAFAVPFKIELMLSTSGNHAPYEVGGRASRMVPQTFVAMIHPNTSYSKLQDILKQWYDELFSQRQSKLSQR